MGFWDEEDFTPYEQGGVTGPRQGGYEVIDQNADVPAPQQSAAAQPFDPNQQVGHDGSINGLNREQWRDKWMSSGARTIEDLQRFVSENGGRVVSGNGTVTTPFGETGDILIGARSGGNGRAGWLGDGSGQTGGGAAAPLSGFSGGTVGGGGGYGGGGGAPQSVLTSGTFDPYKYEDFKAPGAAGMLEDPGYQARLTASQRALTNNASSRGLLRSTNASQAFMQNAGDLASQEYQQSYNRALSTNQANNAGRLAGFSANTNAALGQGSLNLGYTRAGNDYALGQGQLALGNKQADQSYDLGNKNVGLGYYSAGNAYDLGMGRLNLDTQGQTFNQGYSLADLGLRAGALQGGYGSSYGNNAASLYTGQGNANAASTLARGNAYTNGITGAGNAALSGYYQSQYGNGGRA